MTERRRDPYAILGVPRDASREHIARAYRALAKHAHPDLSAQPSSEMQDLNWAWGLLSNAGRRREWDGTHGRVSSASHWTEPGPSEREAPQRREEPYSAPWWTVSGEPWAGAGAPVVQRRAGIGCIAMMLLVLVMGGAVLMGGFLSGYQSPGGEPAQQSDVSEPD